MNHLTQQEWEAMVAEQGFSVEEANAIVEAASDQHANDDREIDGYPELSHADGEGCWVQGWFWVSCPDPVEEDE